MGISNISRISNRPGKIILTKAPQRKPKRRHVDAQLFTDIKIELPFIVLGSGDITYTNSISGGITDTIIIKL